MVVDRELVQPADESAGVKFVRMDSGRAVFAIGSGAYEFTAQD